MVAQCGLGGDDRDRWTRQRAIVLAAVGLAEAFVTPHQSRSSAFVRARGALHRGGALILPRAGRAMGVQRRTGIYVPGHGGDGYEDIVVRWTADGARCRERAGGGGAAGPT